MKNKIKDVLIRAAKTFWQAAAAYIVATFGTQLAGVDWLDADALATVLIGITVGALAVGLCASVRVQELLFPASPLPQDDLPDQADGEETEA